MMNRVRQLTLAWTTKKKSIPVLMTRLPKLLRCEASLCLPQPKIREPQITPVNHLKMMEVVSASRHVGARYTLMVVCTSTGNLGAVLWNLLNRPPHQTITDRGIAMIPLPDRGHPQDWRTPPPPPKALLYHLLSPATPGTTPQQSTSKAKGVPRMTLRATCVLRFR